MLGSRFGYWVQDPASRLWTEVLIDAASDLGAEAFWRERFISGSNTKLEVFRLLTPPNASPTSTEEWLLLDLPDAAFLRYLLGFGEVTIPLYGRLLVSLGRTDTLTTQQVVELARYARKAEDSNLYDVLLRAVDRLRCGADRASWAEIAMELADGAWPSGTRQGWQQYFTGRKSVPAPLTVSLRLQSTKH